MLNVEKFYEGRESSIEELARYFGVPADMAGWAYDAISNSLLKCSIPVFDYGYARSGKIQAIKALREWRPGLGLRDAKNIWETITESAVVRLQDEQKDERDRNESLLKDLRAKLARQDKLLKLLARNNPELFHTSLEKIVDLLTSNDEDNDDE